MANNRAALIDMARRHALLEANMDLAGTLATMEAPYFYEAWPLGLRMEGLANTRRYYQYHFETLRPRIIGRDKVAEWVGDDGLVFEQYLHIRMENGSVEKFRFMAVLALGENRVTGERIYASERFFGLLFGPLLETAFKPVTPP